MVLFARQRSRRGSRRWRETTREEKRKETKTKGEKERSQVSWKFLNDRPRSLPNWSENCELFSGPREQLISTKLSKEAYHSSHVDHILDFLPRRTETEAKAAKPVPLKNSVPTSEFDDDLIAAVIKARRSNFAQVPDTLINDKGILAGIREKSQAPRPAEIESAPLRRASAAAATQNLSDSKASLTGQTPLQRANLLSEFAFIWLTGLKKLDRLL